MPGPGRSPGSGTGSARDQEPASNRSRLASETNDWMLAGPNCSAGSRYVTGWYLSSRPRSTLSAPATAGKEKRSARETETTIAARCGMDIADLLLAGLQEGRPARPAAKQARPWSGSGFAPLPRLVRRVTISVCTRVTSGCSSPSAASCWGLSPTTSRSTTSARGRRPTAPLRASSPHGRSWPPAWPSGQNGQATGSDR